MTEDLTKRIENLSAAKRALLEKKLRQKSQAVEEPSTIPLRAERHSAPLSYNQESLWFIEQLNPGLSLYNLPEAVRLKGTLNVTALHQALDAIVMRHESLRVGFRQHEGQPEQFIRDSHPVELPLTDFSPQPDAEESAIHQLNLEATRPFDLSADALIRFSLIRLHEQEHLLLIVMHHIISDGWSVGVLWKELAQLYQDFSENKPASLPELPVQFGDYTAWLRTQLTGEAFHQQLEYWKQRLAGAPALLELPTDRPRPAQQSYRGVQFVRTLPQPLSEELKALSQREGVTLFMTLLAAFKTLLLRYTGQEDLVVGSPVAGRTHRETENLIGFFVNTPVLRTDLSGDLTFREALRRVRETTVGALANQEVPFDRLVAELHPERSLSYNPLFQTAFALQPDSSAPTKLPGLTVLPLKLGSITSKFDLLLSLTATPDGLRATIEYSTDLFDAITIERMLQHYFNLLAGIVAQPDCRLSELPALSQHELRQALIEWNDTRTAYPREACIHRLFEAQVTRTPRAIALQSGELTMTYQELNERANQLAHRLRSLGIGPDVLVGLFTERSFLAVIGMLGILKAGGAYLPLDVSYPKERMTFMLDDARVPVILTQQRLLPNLPDTAAQTLCLDTDWATISREKPDNLICLTQPDHLAYVIYTSGSTGQPKGVAIEHRAVNRLVFNTNYVELDSSDRMAQVSNMSFDAATFEIWGALLHGARLVLLNRDITLSPAEFATQLRAEQITTIFLTTALFNLLAKETPTIFSSVKQVLFGGEAVDPQWVREILKHGAPQRLLHVYGPTESTTFASWHLVREVAHEAPTIPIGRPLSNTQIYLLDRHQHPVPVGVPGELYIGGDGLARGYLNRPELTAKKFIELSPVSHPWSAIRNKRNGRLATDNRLRLYRTGDLARFLPDGSIEFVGRVDHQIKLRGFRVELGEIETALAAHPDLQNNVVVVHDQAGHDKRLVAYFVTRPEATLSGSDLRAHLAQKLPDYMIPSVFIALESLPLNPNGKVDRKRLPAPEKTIESRERSAVEPKDELELRLKWIWEKVLGVSAISVQDNFFDLGGHSLIAVRLFTEIAKVFDRQLPLATLFQAPTIEQLARVLRERGWQSAWSSLVPLRTQGHKPPFFCVHAVGGNVLEYHNLAQRLDPAQPFYGLQSVGLDGSQPPLQSIEAMAAHYLSEIRQLQPAGPYYLGGRSFGGTVAFEMAQQLSAQGEQVALLAMLDTYPLGWLKLRPQAEALRTKRQFERQHLQQHLRNLAALSLPDKVNYVVSKARYKKRKYTHWLWRLKSREQSAATSSLTERLRDIEEFNYHAAKQYVPRFYEGQVTFFSAVQEVSANENITGWQTLAARVEVINIPGDHQTMIEEPAVQTLAAELQQCLDRAQRGFARKVIP